MRLLEFSILTTFNVLPAPVHFETMGTHGDFIVLPHWETIQLQLSSDILVIQKPVLDPLGHVELSVFKVNSGLDGNVTQHSQSVRQYESCTIR